uniref:Uncharacterized protein n=1 Tax=Heterorhabditis bacteriophora TaxID=37862 RepID=A0A1I7WS60_HETBA
MCSIQREIRINRTIIVRGNRQRRMEITIADKKEEGMMETSMNMFDFFKPSELIIIIVVSIVLLYFVKFIFVTYRYLARFAVESVPNILYRVTTHLFYSLYRFITSCVWSLTRGSLT